MAPTSNGIVAPKTRYLTTKIDGLEIFYREAGSKDAPTLLLLHGFPTSSHMFRHLIPMLADRFHIVAPDYPGFGNSGAPTEQQFEYTFDHLAGVMQKFTEAIGLCRYALYAQDFGGPVGFRLAAANPDRVRGLIIQNANAYVEGMSDEVHAFLVGLHTDRSPGMREKAAELFELPYTKKQYLQGVEDKTLVDPDAWQHAQWGMDRPGNKEIQYALHANYASNFARYDEWHRYFRQHQPRALIVWGRGDFVFLVPGAEAFRQDLQSVDLHVLDGAGHFALETHGPEIAEHIRSFMSTLAD